MVVNDYCSQNMEECSTVAITRKRFSLSSSLLPALKHFASLLHSYFDFVLTTCAGFHIRRLGVGELFGIVIRLVQNGFL